MFTLTPAPGGLLVTANLKNMPEGQHEFHLPANPSCEEEGFAAGEMKHGPIALIEDDLPVICLLDEDALSAKTISNLKEAEARGATIILIATQTVARQVDFASYKVVIEDCDPLLAPIILAVPAQILAYQTAFEKGTDVDQPRNLAKSVTVE